MLKMLKRCASLSIPRPVGPSADHIVYSIKSASLIRTLLCSHAPSRFADQPFTGAGSLTTLTPYRQNILRQNPRVFLSYKSICVQLTAVRKRVLITNHTLTWLFTQIGHVRWQQRRTPAYPMYSSLCCQTDDIADLKRFSFIFIISAEKYTRFSQYCQTPCEDEISLSCWACSEQGFPLVIEDH